MSASVIFFSSGVLLVLYSLLCQFEAKRGERLLLRRLRSFFDALILKVFYFVTRVKIHFGAGAVRMFAHYCVHKVLSICLWLLRNGENFVKHLQKQNRIVATVVRKEHTQTHLDAIAEHKASVTLTEAEKEKIKKQSLEED